MARGAQKIIPGYLDTQSIKNALGSCAYSLPFLFLYEQKITSFSYPSQLAAS
jgi:hypothetical protein